MSTTQTKCGMCHKLITKHALKLTCTQCLKRFHFNCIADMRRTDYETLSGIDRRWMCGNCLNDVFPFNHLVDSNEYMAAISESWYNVPTPNLEELDAMRFIPFETDEDIHNALNEIDPDANFFTENIKKLLKAVMFCWKTNSIQNTKLLKSAQEKCCLCYTLI